MRFVSACLSLSAIGLVACGGGGGGGSGDDGPDDIDAAPGAADAGAPDADNSSYTMLIGRSWGPLPGGTQDTYRCVRVTMTEDVYVHSFRAQAPLGTHHTVLGIATGVRPDGDYDCGTAEVGHQMLFASGVGTADLTFPAGIAVKIAKGQQIVLNLHLFNASDTAIPLSESGILVETMRAEDVQQEAEAIFAGTFDIDIEVSTRAQTAQGGCTVERDYTLFALWPHMHQLGTKQLVTWSRGSETKTLHDAAYTFFEQTYYLVEPQLAVKRGDRIDVTCTYVNTTTMPVGWGEGSEAEMCFTGLYRYPALNSGVFDCTTGGPF
jgi:hypothetical protein